MRRCCSRVGRSTGMRRQVPVSTPHSLAAASSCAAARESGRGRETLVPTGTEDYGLRRSGIHEGKGDACCSKRMKEETEISTFALTLFLTHEIPACDGCSSGCCDGSLFSPSTVARSHGSSSYPGRVILACLTRKGINQERTRLPPGAGFFG